MEADPSDYDEGENFSSDDDYSPGSLVIDTEGGDTSNPPSPQPLVHSGTSQFISTTSSGFKTVTLSSITPSEALPVTPSQPYTVTLCKPVEPQEIKSYIPKRSEMPRFNEFSSSQSYSPHSSTHTHIHTPTDSTPSQSHALHSSTLSQPTDSPAGIPSPPLVTLGQRVLVSKEGCQPIDTLCVYFYRWRDIQLDILVTNQHPTYIPIKNVYQRAIPCLKQNVLSARISKHGIRSAVLPEPYVSTLKKLGMGLTGSSHYITIPDFFKICRYFKYSPPESLSHFRLINAGVAASDVLEIFNDPGSAHGRELLETLAKSEGVSSVMSLGGGATAVSAGASPTVSSHEEKERFGEEAVVEVDARTLTLMDGRTIVLLIKGGIPYIPNPELAKLLPNITRTAMEVIRNTYGIIVEQSSKHEINLMKALGIVSPKAGRTLLYKVSDVAKMYPHWKMVIPDFIDELCAGKIPEDKVDPSIVSRLNDSSFIQSPLNTSHTSRPRRRSKKKQLGDPLWPRKVEDERSYGGGGGGVEHVWSPSNEHVHTHTSLTTHTPSHLTPDWFQQPVKLLNSIQLALSNPSEYPTVDTTGSSGHMTSAGGVVLDSLTSHVTTPSSHVTNEFGSKLPRRRSSSSSAPPLDDTGVDYSSLAWGDHVLTLLCPHGNQPYLPVPDFVKKVLEDRSHMSPQRRTQLGVVTLPATSLQIHTLRAHRSLEDFSGNVKLVSLSDAVRVAVNADLNVPGNVIHTLRSYQNFIPVPLESLLTPQPMPPTPSPSLQSHAPLQKFLLPSRPDIIDLGRSFHLSDGLLCQIKWGEVKLVVYAMDQGDFYMGLYQVYEELFKQYVTRVNFKMRMRKLHVRSIRAAPIVRVKLIEVGALPPHCPVCGLILVSQVEKLAKSYGVIPPNVIYEVFLSQETRIAPTVSHSKVGRPKKVPIHRKDPSSRPAPPSLTTPSPSTHNVFMYQFNDSPYQPHPTVSLVSRPSDGTTTPSQSSNPIGLSDTDRLVSPVYGVVPYLTSARESLGESPNSKHLTMTSSPPVSIDQLIPKTENDSFVVSIPRGLTQFQFTQSISTSSSTVAPVPTKPAPVPLGGSRRKVLQNLAKKIAQKSRKYTVNSQFSSSQSRSILPKSSGFGPVESGLKMCTSCRKSNPLSKKRCVFCGSVLGRSCPTCGVLNLSSATSCVQCHTNLTYTWSLPVVSSKTSSESLVSTAAHSLSTMASDLSPKVGVASVSPTSSSPTSPKFSAPPIRSAVLKNLFPQDSRHSESTSSAPLGNSAQVMSNKTMFLGNLASSRKCPECGQLNTRMAKKCIQCRSHLQGRACTRCGRPNLSIVSECYKCGAPLPSSAPSTKWVYRGGRSGREYKAPLSHEEKILQSSAPISCIRCHNIRLSNYFKCGRCGDVFKTHPLVDKTPEAKKEDGEEAIESSNQKKSRTSPDFVSEIGSAATISNDSSQLEQFGLNILTLDLGDQLTPLFLQREEKTRNQLPQAEEELEAADTEYLAFLQKKQLLEATIEEEQAELNGLLQEMERLNSLLDNILSDEHEAQQIVEGLPDQISSLKEKLGSINVTYRLFTNTTREV